MTDQPTRLNCRTCKTPLASMNPRRDRIILLAGCSALVDVFSRRAVLTCQCHTETIVTDVIVEMRVRKEWMVEPAKSKVLD